MAELVDCPDKGRCGTARHYMGSARYSSCMAIAHSRKWVKPGVSTAKVAPLMTRKSEPDNTVKEESVQTQNTNPQAGKKYSKMHVVGTSFRPDSFQRALSERGPLTLRPEPDNQYDPNAVAVYHKDEQIGYMSSKIAAWMNRQHSRYGVGFRVIKVHTFSRQGNHGLWLDVESYDPNANAEE